MSNDVNISICRWREALARGESISVERIDELQDHLTTELETIPTHGLNDDERVLLAARRIGPRHQLESEFFDADPSYVWRRRVVWMIVGVFVLSELPELIMGLLTPTALLVALIPSLRVPDYIVALSMAAGIFIVWGGGLYLVTRLMQGKPKCRGLMGWIKGHPGLAIVGFLAVFIVARMISRLAFGIATVLQMQDGNFTGSIDQVIAESIGYTAIGLIIPTVFGYLAWVCLRRPSVA